MSTTNPIKIVQKHKLHIICVLLWSVKLYDWNENKCTKHLWTYASSMCTIQIIIILPLTFTTVLKVHFIKNTARNEEIKLRNLACSCMGLWVHNNLYKHFSFNFWLIQLNTYPNRWFLVYLVESFVQSSKNRDECWPHCLICPFSWGQYVTHIMLKASTCHCIWIIWRYF